MATTLPSKVAITLSVGYIWTIKQRTNDFIALSDAIAGAV